MSSAAEIRTARARAGLTQHELARRVGTSQPAINRYERGRTAPSAATLHRILGACSRQRVRPLEALLANRDEVIARLHHYGASQVFVFGSVARGTDTSDSDVDLLVDRLDVSAYSWGVPKAKHELEDLLGVAVDIGEVRMLRPSVLERAMADAVPL